MGETRQTGELGNRPDIGRIWSDEVNAERRGGGGIERVAINEPESDPTTVTAVWSTQLVAKNVTL